ncbi:MAG: hypothetical protein ACRD6X_10710, partial [Pyrinomonadaceae bacterium]
AALALEQGQIAPNLVDTDYGFHIIKLEKKGVSDDPNLKGQETYDVRHILITTSVKDPESPIGGEKPVKIYVRQKLETDKQKTLLDEIIARNHVSVPEDFVVPTITDEQIQEAMKKQQEERGFDPEAMNDGPPPPAQKPEAKKSK